jgi:DNA invertase Pin-like site-specific DNA recombinase
MNKIYGYVRVSTKDLQFEKGSHEIQISLIQDYVKQNNLELEKIYLDKTSGKNLDRPGIQELLMNLDNIDVLLVRDQSRLTRETRDISILAELFAKSETKVVGIKESIDLKTPLGEMIAEIKASVDKYDRRKINIRQKDSIKKIIDSGGHWGRPYKIKDKTFNYWYYQKNIKNKNSLALILGVTRKTIYNYMERKGLLKKIDDDKR